jgi:hypothetical protein
MPVLDLVTELVDAAVQRVAGNPESSVTGEQIGAQAMRLTRAIVRAAESGELDNVRAAVEAPLFSGSEYERAQTALSEPLMAASPDERAQEMARRLKSAAEGQAT